MVESVREIGERIERENRYYVSSLRVPTEQMGALVRSHWAVENSLHWVLDRVFRDDECRVRTRPRARQLHHHQTHGTESATAREGQALDTRGAQGRCMGR